MARKAGDPKVRYIGFRIDATDPLPRQAVIRAIKQLGQRLDADLFDAAEPWLTRYDGRYGIVRCTHHTVQWTRDLLGSMGAGGQSGERRPTDVAIERVETLGTSGTIRGLMTKHMPDLKDTGRRNR